MKYLKLLVFSVALGIVGMLVPATANAVELIDSVESTSVNEFRPCFQGNSHEISAEVTSLGDDLGDGISETVTEEVRAVVNKGLVGSGENPLPDEAAVLRYMSDGRILAIDSNGHQVTQVSGPSSNSVSNQSSLPAGSGESSASGMNVSPQGIFNEVKRIIGACLGFGGAGGMGFEQLVRWLGNPVNAAKFVIRRIGIVGAISCIGGIIWEYI